VSCDVAIATFSISWISHAASLARVEPVDAGDAGLVLTRRNAVLQTMIAVCSIFGGFGVALGPEAVVHYFDIKVPEWVSAVLVCWMVGVMVLMRWRPTFWNREVI